MYGAKTLKIINFFRFSAHTVIIILGQVAYSRFLRNVGILPNCLE